MRVFKREEVDTIIRLFTIEKKSQLEIATKYGVSSRPIVRILKENGIETSHYIYKDIETINKIKQLYSNGESSLKIASQLNISKSKVLQILHNQGINRKKYCEYSRYRDEYAKICSMYESGLSALRIAKIYGGSHTAIQKIIKKHGNGIRPSDIRGRRYYFDTSFFKTIDAQEKAYCLGLMYSDGCNFPDGRKIALSLHIKDIELLESFRSCLKSQHKIKKCKRSNCLIFEIFSKEACRDLESLGCVPNKSKILKFPTEDIIPYGLMPHFIRGYFDGDGCIYINKLNRPMFSFASSEFFIKGLQNFLIRTLKIKGTAHPQKGCWNLNIGGSIQALRFAKWMYNNSTIRMRRKYDKYISFREFYLKNRKPNKRFKMEEI